MKLADAMDQLGPVMGVSSMLGAPHSTDPRQVSPSVTLDDARDRLAVVKQAQDAATSDYAYWGYQGQVSYLKAVVSLLSAAEIADPDNLPDIAMPDLSNKVVMDACAEMERWAGLVLEAAAAVTVATAAEASRASERTVSYVVEYPYRGPGEGTAKTVGFATRDGADRYAAELGWRSRIIKVTEEVITPWTDPR